MSPFTLAVLGGTAVIALAILGFVWFRHASEERQLASVEEARAREAGERAQIMEEGNRLVGAGTYGPALAKFRELVRRDPSSVVAREAVARTEELLGEQEKAAARAREVEGHLVTAREANAAADDLTTIEQAEAAIALDGANAEATSLRDAARSRAATRSAAEQKKLAEALKKKAKPTPTPMPLAAAPAVAVRPHREALPPTPTPGTTRLQISFPSPITDGHFMVGLDDKIVFKKSFNFGKKSSGGLIEGAIDVSSGKHAVKIWVIDTSSSSKQYFQELSATVPGGESRTLRVDLGAGGNLSAVIR